MTRRWLLLLALPLAPACAELSPIDAGVCGNLIIEGDEQCRRRARPLSPA